MLFALRDAAYCPQRAIVSYLRKDTKSGNGYIDTAFSIFPENVYPLPLYDDLCEVARVCRKQETPVIRFARYGGDETKGAHGANYIRIDF